MGQFLVRYVRPNSGTAQLTCSPAAGELFALLQRVNGDAAARELHRGSLLCPRGAGATAPPRPGSGAATASIFNKTREHFPSLKDYNDYLEEVEDMTFNLIEGFDVEAIEAKIARYQQENSEQIYLSRAKRAEDLAAALQASRMNPVKAGTSDTAAESSQGISGGVGVQGQYAPAAVPGGLNQPRPTGNPPQPIGGSSDPLHGYDEETMRLRAERGARAGGWTADLGKRRALEEAFNSIFV